MLTSNRFTLSGLALACLAGFASAQASEVPSMSCPPSRIDMDAVGPATPCTMRNCPVTVNMLNAAGTPAAALISSIQCLQNPSAPATGAYNEFTTGGRALVCATTTSTSTFGLFVIDEPNSGAGVATSTYRSADYCISFSFNHQEFGLQIGDWGGPLTLEFYEDVNCGGRLVGRIATTTNFGGAPKFFRVRGDCFRSVLVAAPDASRAANFVITELWTQRRVGSIVDPTTAQNTCFGSNGLRPTQTAMSLGAVASVPESCERLQITVRNGIPGSPGTFVIAGPAPLAPISLGLIGGPATCFIKAPLAPVAPITLPIVLNGSGAFTFTFTIPPGLCGGAFASEFWLADFGLPQAIKVTTSNLLRYTIQ